MAYRIFTDASADISEDLMRDVPPVDMIPMEVILDGEEHLFGPGGDLEVKSFYERQRAGKFASTSAINPEAYRKAFVPVLQAGEDILHVGLTQGLSSTFSTCCLVMDELREEFPERKIIAVEPYCASVGLGMLVHEMSRKKAEGMTIEELAAWVEENRLHICHWFTVDIFDHLKHGGRVSAAAAVVGTMLQIKPLLHIETDGTLKVIAKPRGRKQAIRQQMGYMKDNWKREMGNLVLIGHGDDQEACDQLKAAVLAEYPDADVRTAYIGALIGAHTGPGMLALIHWGEKR